MIARLPYLMLMSLPFVIGCGGNSKEKIVNPPVQNGTIQLLTTREVDSEGNSEEFSYFFDNSGTRVKQGKFTGYYPDGTKHYEGTYDQGQIHGHWIEYYPSGNKKNEGQLSNGKFEGLWSLYREDGTIEIQSTFAGGNLDGEWKEFDKSGKVIRTLNYRNDKRWSGGPFRDYYESDEVKAEMYYENGLKQGTYTEFYVDGTTKFQGSYKNDVPDGTWVEFHENGRRMRQGSYVSGKKEGSWITYSETDGSTKQVEENYSGDMLEGKRLTYFDDGDNIKVEENYSSNLLDGARLVYEIDYGDSWGNNPLGRYTATEEHYVSV